MLWPPMLQPLVGRRTRRVCEAMNRTLLEGLAGEDTPAARAGIEAFAGRVQSLIAAGTLAAADGQAAIVATTTVDSAGGLFDDR